MRIQALEMGPGITYTRKNRACPFFKSGVSSIGSEYFPSTCTFPHGSIRESIYLLDFVILHERKKGGSILIGVLRESKYIYIYRREIWKFVVLFNRRVEDKRLECEMRVARAYNTEYMQTMIKIPCNSPPNRHPHEKLYYDSAILSKLSSFPSLKEKKKKEKLSNNFVTSSQSMGLIVKLLQLSSENIYRCL